MSSNELPPASESGPAAGANACLQHLIVGFALSNERGSGIAAAGIDIDMPGGIGSPFGIPDLTVMTPEDLEQSGADVVNDRVRRMLRRIVSYDFIYNPPQESDAAKKAAAKNSRKVAIQSAREGIVLLESKKNFLFLSWRVHRHPEQNASVIWYRLGKALAAKQPRQEHLL